MGTPTPKLGLARPDAGDTDWTTEINDNWTTLDDAYVADQEIECSGLKVPYDDVKVQVGAGDDMGMWYDGTHGHINMYRVGSGNLAIGDVETPLATVHAEDANGGTTLYAQASGYPAGVSAQRTDGTWIRLHAGAGTTALIMVKKNHDLEIVGAPSNGTTPYDDSYTAGHEWMLFSSAGQKIIAYDPVRFESSIRFGASEDVRLARWAADKLLLYTGDSFCFRDTDIYITSDADGHLDLHADVSIDLEDDTLVGSGHKLSFRDTDLYVTSDDDGHLDLTADTSVDVNALLDISAQNIKTDTSTGTKIGTATDEKLGFFNATPVVQQPHTSVSDPPTKAEVEAIRDALVNLGLMASS